MLLFWSEPKDRGNTLGRSLKLHQHLESLRKNLTSRVVPMRRLVGSGWGAVATRLQTATLALVRSKAEDCAPLWCRSAHGHIHLTDRAINDALIVVTGCLRPTPVDNLPTGHPTCWASSQRSRWSVSGTLHHSAWTSAPLSAHPSLSTERECTSSQMKTPICTRLKPAHQFIWQQQQRMCGGLGGSPVDFGVAGQHYETAYFHPRNRHPSPWKGLSKHSKGQAQPPLRWCRLLPLLLAQMLYGLFCGFWTWHRRTNHQPCCPPMSNPPISPWTARPDDCVGWDTLMVAQPLPQDPILLSSG